MDTMLLLLPRHARTPYNHSSCVDEKVAPCKPQNCSGGVVGSTKQHGDLREQQQEETLASLPLVLRATVAVRKIRGAADVHMRGIRRAAGVHTQGVRRAAGVHTHHLRMPLRAHIGHPACAHLLPRVCPACAHLLPR
eukprot:5078393-Pyramimonas_sp.AAC.1